MDTCIGGFLLEWKDLNYKLSLPAPRNWKSPSSYFQKRPRQILTNVSGYAEAGKMTVILGPSGCGKTSLLNALAYRTVKTPGSSLTGSIAYDGHLTNTSVGQKFLGQTAFVEQDPVNLAEMTVQESVDFGHSIVFPSGSPVDRETRVKNDLEDFGLLRIKDSLVGSAHVRGVSGGERRRVNILSELYGDPKLYFLDEPTSGLDSFRAMGVVTTLKNYCERQGRTVIAVIHQPSSALFQLFDQVIVMAPGGRLIYCGAGGDKLGQYFGNMGYPLPLLYNPADFVVDLSGTLSADAIQELASANFEVRPEIEPLRALPPLKLEGSWWNTMRVLLNREFTLIMRDKHAIKTDLILMALFTALYAVIFWFAPRGPVQQALLNTKAFALIIMIEVIFQHFYSANTIACKRYNVMTREVKGGLVSSYQFVLAQMAARFVYRFTTRFPFDVIMYLTSPLTLSFLGYLYFHLAIFLLLLVTSAYAAALTYGYAGNLVASSTTFTLLTNFMILTGGFYFSKPETSGFVVILIDWFNSLAMSMELMIYTHFLGTIFEDCFDTQCFVTGSQALAANGYLAPLPIKFIRFLWIFLFQLGIALFAAKWFRPSYLSLNQTSAGSLIWLKKVFRKRRP